jgi:tetratricopeptide (TPR) repeat protein
MNRSLIRVRTYLSLSTLALALASCASSQLTVESDPAGADIYVVTSGNVKQKLGQTPLTITPSQLPVLFSSESQIQVSKEGFRAESFLLPPQSTGTIGRIQAKLSEDSVSKTCLDSSNALSEATDAVAQVQRLIYRKNYFEAEKALATYTVKYSAVPVFHSLLGNVLYLQKNLARALESYQRASALQPQNLENQKMVQRLKEMRGTESGTR